MKTKKTMVALAAVTALALGLSACGTDGDDGGSGTGSDAGGAASGNTLTVWAWDPAFNIYAMEEAEKLYQVDHPDFTLDVVETPWEDLQAKLTALGQSQTFDELPDIFLMQNNAFQKNVLAYPDLAASYADAGIDWSEYPTSVVDYSVIDGENYGLPFDNGTAIATYRTDVLEQAGYTVDDFTDITWSEFSTLAKDVLAKTGKPLLSGPAGASDMIMIMLQSAGASLFDDEGNPTIADNDTLATVVDTYKGLVEDGIFLEVNSWDEYIGTFANDSVAGVINGCWILGTVQTAEDQSGLWAVTNIPKLDNVSGATNYSASGGSSWAISSTADYDLAVDFLKATFGSSTELYDTILPSAGALANWLPAGESDVYAEPQEFFGGDAIYAKIVAYAADVPSNNTGAYYYEARDLVSAAVTKVLGGEDMATALQEAQDNVEFAMQ